MRETQHTVGQWADETFGLVTGGALSTIVRANEEMAELMKAIAHGENQEKILKEIADIIIVLWRVGWTMQVLITDDDYIVDVRIEDYRQLVNHANIEMAKLIAATMIGGETTVTQRIARIVIDLERAGELLGVDIHDIIDAKMAINRGRRWQPDGTGHGYHVKESAPPSSPSSPYDLSNHGGLAGLALAVSRGKRK